MGRYLCDKFGRPKDDPCFRIQCTSFRPTARRGRTQYDGWKRRRIDSPPPTPIADLACGRALDAPQRRRRYGRAWMRGRRERAATARMPRPGLAEKSPDSPEPLNPLRKAPDSESGVARPIGAFRRGAAPDWEDSPGQTRRCRRARRPGQNGEGGARDHSSILGAASGKEDKSRPSPEIDLSGGRASSGGAPRPDAREPPLRSGRLDPPCARRLADRRRDAGRPFDRIDRTGGSNTGLALDDGLSADVRTVGQGRGAGPSALGLAGVALPAWSIEVSTRDPPPKQEAICADPDQIALTEQRWVGGWT